MDWWVDYFEDLNGDLSKFNAFMHNKIQLFTPHLQTFNDRINSAASSTGIAVVSLLSPSLLASSPLSFPLSSSRYSYPWQNQPQPTARHTIAPPTTKPQTLS